MSTRYQQIVEQLHTAVGAATGYAYLESFVAELGRLFGADCAMVAVLDDEDPTCLRTLAVSIDGSIGAELVWPLPGSPGAALVAPPSAAIFKAGIQDKFPNDDIIRRLQVDSYIGVPIVASDGDVLGLIILMARKAIADELLAVEIAQLFADRVVAEIERLYTESASLDTRDALENRAHHLEEELQRTRQELENFTYAVSHDLRGPLRAIKGFSQSLAEEYADRIDAVAADYLRRLRHNATLMDELINALLTLSRVTRHILQPADVNLSRICEEVLGRFRALDPERVVAVAVQPDVEVCGDPGLLTIMMEQLLSNAWKFTANVEHAQITFSADDRDGEPVYRLTDNGAGFDMAYADKLFSIFQRLHGRQAFPGIGAGLATVKRIIDRHGGKVWAEAEPGRGASIYFTLPRQAAA